MADLEGPHGSVTVCGAGDLRPAALHFEPNVMFEPVVFRQVRIGLRAGISRLIARYGFWVLMLTLVVTSRFGYYALAVGIVLLANAAVFLAWPQIKPTYLRVSPQQVEILRAWFWSEAVRPEATIRLADYSVQVDLRSLTVTMKTLDGKGPAIALGLAAFRDPIEVTRTLLMAANSPHPAPVTATDALSG